MKKISISDITLKKLSEDRSLVLLFREKSAIANCADAIGVDAIELPAVKSLREDTIIYKTIAQNVRNASLAVPVGFSIDEMTSAWECIKDAKKPRLQIELPVSTIQMEYTYHIKQNKMLEKISELVKAAKELCADVEFSALDATRADEDFLISAVKEAENSGATVITVCDDAGASTPDDIASLTKKVKEAVSVPVWVKVSDRVNMAVASAFSAVKAGADGLKCAMVGSDILLTGELSDAVNTCGAQIDAEIRLDRTKIHASIDDMTANISHDTYENENTVSEKKNILLDADSTLTQVAQAAKVLGYDLSDIDVGNVHKALKQVCEKKGAVGAKEFEALIASSAMQAPSTYHFESYTTTSSNLASSMSQVTLRRGDEMISGVSNGDGPIDSAFRAIEQCIGHHYELDDFQVQSVTEGKEALGSALVRLRNNGKLYSGNGISTDIVAASIRAYINALNKIVFEEA
jgi:2-isopropylmalate synthase